MTSTVLASGAALAGAAPAQAFDGENRSHALAELINADALGIDAATAVTAEQNFLDDEGEDPATSTIDAELLNQLAAVDLGGVSVGIGLDGLGVGALSGFAHTPEPTSATAASGTVTSEGAIEVSGDTTGFASVDLTAALADLGLSTEGIVDDLSLELGALASRAQETEGTLDSEYVLAGAQLSLDSPALAELTGLLNGAVDEIDTAVNGLLAAEGPVQDALDTVPTEPVEVNLIGDLDLLTVNLGSPELNAAVDLAGVADDLLAAPLVSTSELVTLDLSTGEILVDLAQLHGGSLNGLPANTTLLTPGEIELILNEVTGLLSELGDNVTAAVNTAIEGTAVSLTLDPDVSAAFGAVSGGIDITINTTVAELLGGGEGISEGDIEIGGDLSLPGADGLLGQLLEGLVTPILTDLVPAIAAPFTAELEAGLGTLAADTVDNAIDPVLSGLTPVFDSLNEIVSLTVNAQSSPGDLGETSFTVRALVIDVLPSIDTAAVQLASSTVYAEDEAEDEPGDFDTEISADPSSVDQGESTTVTGTGFAPEETVTVSIPGATQDDDPLTVTTTDDDGAFTAELPIPTDYPTGDATITAVGEDSQTPATTVITVTPPGDDDDDDEDADQDPTITVDPDTAAPGETITIGGDDFTPGTTVDIDITDDDGNTIDTIEDIPVNDNGEFTHDWTVPEGTPPGNLTVTAEDEEGNSANAPLEIIAVTPPGDDDDDDEDADQDPTITVDPDTAAPGETITIGGDDFTPGTTVDIDITDDDGNTIDTIEDIPVNDNGEFTHDWTVPSDLGEGALIVTATDQEGNTASAVLDVVGAPVTGVGDSDDGTQADGAADTAGTGGALAMTGATVGVLAAAALVLVIMGVGIYAASRRRRSPAAD
ncbi:choice-of-anchor G family protein [Nesterenkonia populi]|uniref:choice-of-anchor G family protein n=1 Tax=Nesterenkonia populi TaxID=1591087 RepID=UPI001478F755|nr:choice-of-anchor G family protein [Nesterenkonia populi]